ncbi:uncharacterized protein ColSpa_04012 [Colletotrichum spaethianum]|uniref:Uncharacterized protein n=1 Tax=Colletotrichum spaethianum TaxID=700344 RepID=A0AA37L8L0_9PEZI|nr:uncharacterized protein ColSpa_04012 [Colletotrichum spaethianum]GKT43831.1 hypothetical protein ColSpa_04012 [Colletotrichum spaethianum]
MATNKLMPPFVLTPSQGVNMSQTSAAGFVSRLASGNSRLWSTWDGTKPTFYFPPITISRYLADDQAFLVTGGQKV